MSNLTISMDDKLIKAARVQAIQQGTSLSAKIRDFVAQYVAAGTPPQPYVPVTLPVYRDGPELAIAIDPSRSKSHWDAVDTTDQSNTPANSLLRMMQDVRKEIALAQQPAATQQVNTDPSRSTLRDQLYQGDYRTRDRIECDLQRIISPSVAGS